MYPKVLNFYPYFRCGHLKFGKKLKYRSVQICKILYLTNINRKLILFFQLQ